VRAFRSVFAPDLTAYVTLRRGLGLKFEIQVSLLRAFDRYAHKRRHQGPLSQTLALSFATQDTTISAGQCARRYHVVRHFSDYLATFFPDTPRLDPKALRCRRTRPPAYIFTDAEMRQLLYEARHISPRHPVRGITLHTMVGLAASTGLRIGETVRLDKADVDLKTGLLTIRETKFNKNRLVPVHPTTLEALRSYSSVRDVTFHGGDCPAFFINMQWRRFLTHAIQGAFRELTRRIGLRGSKGKGPSFHDLRHGFAVGRLVAWYKAGDDVQAKLPALATYMGHVHYSSTSYYVTATAELMGLAAARFDTHQEQARR
jgi:integrase